MSRLPLVACTLVMAACPSRSKSPAGPSPTLPAQMSFDLPPVPSKLELTRVAPSSDNDPRSASPILETMATENQRWMTALASRPDPAHYLSYQVAELRVVSLEAEGGALVEDSDERQRNLDVDLRVGTPALDNTRSLSDDPNGANQPMVRRGVVPFGDDASAIRRALWLETDRRYREGVSQLAYVRQDQSTLKARDKAVADFAKSEPVTYAQPLAKLEFDKRAWVARLKTCSAKALRGHATRGNCSVLFAETTTWFVNSEGSRVQQSSTSAQLAVSVGVKADDGMGLSRVEQRFAVAPSGLPSDAEVDAMITSVTRDLDALHEAPLAEPYVGPAILEGRAAGVFFHEVFGHRIEGHRQKDDTGGQTFASYVGKEVAPSWLSVYDDPTLRTINGLTVNGFYRYDDEGVVAQRVSLIDKGKLVGFVMGRNPIDGFTASNGHGRKQPRLPAVARQGNLVVETTHSVERAELEKMLLAEVKKRGRPFGMVFTDISGGFTNTSAFAPQAFKVNPVLAYRIYPDGRRELVRGIDISGTPLVALQSIRAASREVATFNGVCGAESGWVPVSASAPSLLIETLEVEKSFVPPDRPPILAPPALRQAPTSATTGGVR